MKTKTAMALVVAGVLAAAPLAAGAQEQQPGQPLYFPKEELKERPSDLHMGSDPGYRPGAVVIPGTDETGYPAYADPQQEVVEEKTIYKEVDRYEKDSRPPSRWGR
ncbi:MAG: hypothetical protein JXA24_02985 [Proteobacteria bacterium]|nr:hypothetical protein [Pseudomonadota bacterium]